MITYTMVIYLFYLGGGGVTSVGHYPTIYACEEAIDDVIKRDGHGSVVARCVREK